MINTDARNLEFSQRFCWRLFQSQQVCTASLWTWKHRIDIVVSCTDPMRNVSWILFQEGRISELRLRQGVEQAAHTLN